MTITRKREAAILFAGDALLFVFALWITLALRYLEIPSSIFLYTHLVPFSFLFAVWVLVFFIAGLYEKHTVLFKRKLPGTILFAQGANIFIAALFFFFIPYFGITPKTNLLIYLIVSFFLILTWRIVLFPRFKWRNRGAAVLIGNGKEAHELTDEVNHNSRYGLYIEKVIELAPHTNPNDLQKDVLKYVGAGKATTVICDMAEDRLEPLLPLLYNLSFLQTQVTFLDIKDVYEELFDRVPLSFIRYEWLLENISSLQKTIYEKAKRLLDICIAAALWLVSLLLYPLIWLSVRLDDGGSLFFIQERVGQDGKIVHIRKFRTMQRVDSGPEVLKSTNKVTRVGKWLRKTRADELPQLWNVLRGDLSLVGPRPEIPELAAVYAEKIPYYNIRHMIKPGLSGWAQIYHENHPHHGTDIEETKNKLSYDLYYLKNRSFFLDVQIILKTIKTLLSRTGA